MEKLREEMARVIETENAYGYDAHHRALELAESILSIPALREALEKAEKWDALTKKYPHFCTRFDPEIDGEVKDETK